MIIIWCHFVIICNVFCFPYYNHLVSLHDSILNFVFVAANVIDIIDIIVIGIFLGIVVALVVDFSKIDQKFSGDKVLVQ